MVWKKNEDWLLKVILQSFQNNLYTSTVRLFSTAAVLTSMAVLVSLPGIYFDFQCAKCCARVSGNGKDATCSQEAHSLEIEIYAYLWNYSGI